MPDPSHDAVVLLSGGLDSMVAAAIARESGFAVNALTIDYNQRHRCEIDAARTIARHLGARRHVVLPLDLRQFGGSALTDDIAVPKDGVDPADIPVTYVPARNLIFLSLTLGWAEAIGAQLQKLAYQVHEQRQHHRAGEGDVIGPSAHRDLEVAGNARESAPPERAPDPGRRHR